MKFNIFLSSFLSGSVALVSAASVLAGVQLLKNDTFSGVLPPINASSLAMIKPPEGFQLSITWDARVKLSWYEDYVNTMEAMIAYAKQPWNGFAGQLPNIISSPWFDSKLEIGRIRSELQIKHIIAALYATGVTIGARRGPDTFKLNAKIILHGRQVGWLLYSLKRLNPDGYTINNTVLLGGGYSNNTLSTSISEQSSNPLVALHSGLSVRRSGWVTDRSDSNFKVHFQCEGTSISASRVFTAFLDGLATAAQHDNDETGAEMLVHSVENHVSIVMYKDPGAATFTWGDLKSALALIWREIVVGYQGSEGSSWEDMNFGIFYKKKKIGEGYMIYFETPPLPPETAVAR